MGLLIESRLDDEQPGGRWVMVVDDPDLAWRHIVEVVGAKDEADARLKAAAAAYDREVAGGTHGMLGETIECCLKGVTARDVGRSADG
jgi:hypothetical protein